MIKLIINIAISLLHILTKQETLGTSFKRLCEQMGLVYIKLAQILSMQDIRFISENSRKEFSHICDKSKPISYGEVYSIINKEYTALYGTDWKTKLNIININKKPVGYASISQVHRGTIIADGKPVQVVFKVKRPNIDTSINNDINTVRKLVKYFGWMLGFKNYKGTLQALSLESKWIRQELDFVHEVYNIEQYKKFAESVNNSIPNCKSIKVPKVYKKFCTSNIIVMEYIPNNQLLSNGNRDKEQVQKAFNSYIKLSFNALFKGKDVIFHGDPHAGNIYIDEFGSIGFLDMGLVFKLTPREAEQTIQLFMCVWFNRKDELFNILRPAFKGTKKQLEKFRIDLYDYLDTVKYKPLTNYFMDLMLICFRYSIVPETFLFNMAKAFTCLGGLSDTYEFDITGTELLKRQVTEYIIDNIEQKATTITDAIHAALTGNKQNLIDALVKII